MRGYFPIDREFFLGSLLGARNREFGVMRLKPIFLRNSRRSREPPTKAAVDETLTFYSGNKSGLKKTMPKRTHTGIEYFSVATSNKEYEGYKGELREPRKEGEREGKLIRPADPVSGGFTLNYCISPGFRYAMLAHPLPWQFLGP